MHQLQRSWVRSQHPSAQWNLRAADEAVLNIVRTKRKNPPKKYLKKIYFEMSCIHLWLAYRSSLSGKKIFFLFRDAIPEAPAVYFCLPTEDNIHRICQGTITYCTCTSLPSFFMDSDLSLFSYRRFPISCRVSSHKDNFDKSLSLLAACFTFPSTVDLGYGFLSGNLHFCFCCYFLSMQFT